MSKFSPGAHVTVDDFDEGVFIVAYDQSLAGPGIVCIWQRVDGKTYEAYVQADRLHAAP
jgi:hypothetical protein